MCPEFVSAKVINLLQNDNAYCNTVFITLHYKTTHIYK